MLNKRIGSASVGWYLKQLMPQSYWTESIRVDNGHRVLHLWKMWLGRCYSVTQVDLGK